MVRRDQRSPQAQHYHRLYKTARWQALRSHQLSRYPLCRMCDDQALITAATICDHVEPHRGDEYLFWNGPFQSLCKPCHDKAKQGEEHRGYSSAIGLDGWPTDSRHPANQKA